MRRALIYVRALINIFGCEERHLFEGGVHLGHSALSDNYGTFPFHENSLEVCPEKVHHEKYVKFSIINKTGKLKV